MTPERRYWVHVVGPMSGGLSVALKTPPLTRAVTPYVSDKDDPERWSQSASRQVCVDANTPEEASAIVREAIVGLGAEVHGEPKLMLVRRTPKERKTRAGADSR